MSKYINADELTEIIETHHYMLANALNSRDYGMFTTGIEQAISETESVEIVRCKDCKYSVEHAPFYLCFKAVGGVVRKADGFCDEGEREEIE